MSELEEGLYVLKSNSEDLEVPCAISKKKSGFYCEFPNGNQVEVSNIYEEGLDPFLLKKVDFDEYIALKRKYFVVDMGRKGRQIKDSFKIYNRSINKIKGNKSLILNILGKEQLSVNQLANRLSMTRQGMRFHIHNLIKEKKIKIIDKSNPNWIYGV